MNHTFRDDVAAYFRARPGIWIDGMDLAPIGGVYAWRSRVSNCRVELGMTIENRITRHGRRKKSEYRYVPKSDPVQPSLLDGRQGMVA